VWGTGSPDWATTPAFLQSGLQALKGRPVRVVNFGESGWVSSQGLIELIWQLKSGNYPDLVLFYDGSNDVYAAYQSGRAGVHQNLDEITARMHGQNSPHPVVKWIKGFPLFSFAEYPVASGLRSEVATSAE
jgi:lysophospholipase L1-like esterase